MFTYLHCTAVVSDVFLMGALGLGAGPKLDEVSRSVTLLQCVSTQGPTTREEARAQHEDEVKDARRTISEPRGGTA